MTFYNGTCTLRNICERRERWINFCAKLFTEITVMNSHISDLCPASRVEFICIRTSVWSSAASPTWTRRRTWARNRRKNSGVTSTALRIQNFRQGAEPRGTFHGAAANRSARPVPLKSKYDIATNDPIRDPNRRLIFLLLTLCDADNYDDYFFNDNRRR